MYNCVGICFRFAVGFLFRSLTVGKIFTFFIINNVICNVNCAAGIGTGRFAVHLNALIIQCDGNRILIYGLFLLRSCC